MKGVFVLMACLLAVFLPQQDCDAACIGDGGGKKVLVAYFSVSGNTRAAAEHIASVTDGDVWSIEPVLPYSRRDLDYRTAASRSNREQHDVRARPQMFRDTPRLDRYDIVFVGYPIWWGIAPRIIQSFLEGDDFRGKTVIPFCTSAESPLDKSVEQIHKSAPGAEWKQGRRFAAGASREKVAEWVRTVLSD